MQVHHLSIHHGFCCACLTHLENKISDENTPDSLNNSIANSEEFDEHYFNQNDSSKSYKSIKVVDRVNDGQQTLDKSALNSSQLLVFEFEAITIV